MCYKWIQYLKVADVDMAGVAVMADDIEMVALVKQDGEFGVVGHYFLFNFHQLFQYYLIKLLKLSYF